MSGFSGSELHSGADNATSAACPHCGRKHDLWVKRLAYRPRYLPFPSKEEIYGEALAKRCCQLAQTGAH